MGAERGTEELDSKYDIIFEKEPTLKDQYELLLKERDASEKAIVDFLNKIDHEYDGFELKSVEETEQDPREIKTLREAEIYVSRHIISNKEKLRVLTDLVNDQLEMESRFEEDHKRILQYGDQEALNMITNKFMHQLEQFSKDCHKTFSDLGIPLFTTRPSTQYKGLTKDRRKLIVYIQKQIEREKKNKNV